MPSWLAPKSQMTNPPVGSGTTEDTSTVCHGDVNLLQQQQVQGAAVHDKAHSDAVVGSTGPVREGAPLGQIQRARSQAIQRGARSHAIQRARSHSLQRVRINTQLTLQPVNAVVGSTGLVREGAPLGQIQRASSLPIQRGARSQVIRRAKSHSIQRTRINTQLTLQPVDKGVAGSSSSHAAGTVGGTVGSTAGGSEGGPEAAMGLRGCALQAALTPRAAPLVSRCV